MDLHTVPFERIAGVFPVCYPARVMLRLLKPVLDQLLVNEEAVLQLWRLDLIRCSDVSRPIHSGLFTWRQFEMEVIFLAVGWIFASRFPIATWRNAFC